MREQFVRVSAEMDGAKIIEENDEYLVVPTILAREGIFPFRDKSGQIKQGYRPASELKDAAFTAEGAWVVSEKHIDTVFVMDSKDIRGKVEKVKFCTDINGLVGQIRWFKPKCDSAFLDAVKKGAKKDVSIGYFCDELFMPGEWSGQKYDFIQRNLMIGHLAAGLTLGRCPSPFCGMQLDAALKAMFDPEETEDYIRIPVSEGEVVATITLSEGEGIKALIGRKDGASFVITYLFEKAKGWTMEKAQAWVDKHKGDSAEIVAKKPCDPLEVIVESQRLLASRHLNDIRKR